jgi:hypothetical protein
MDGSQCAVHHVRFYSISLHLTNSLHPWAGIVIFVTRFQRMANADAGSRTPLAALSICRTI